MLICFVVFLFCNSVVYSDFIYILLLVVDLFVVCLLCYCLFSGGCFVVVCWKLIILFGLVFGCVTLLCDWCVCFCC